MQCHYAYPANGYVAGDPIQVDVSPDVTKLDITRADSTTDINSIRSTYFDADAGAGIGQNYTASVHYTPPFSPNSSDYVTCEGCHGPGSRHQGVGPIPYYNPGIDQCGGCHNPSLTSHPFDLTAFKQTSHANPNASPDKYFGQNGVGAEQARGYYPGGTGGLEYKSDGSPVDKSEHIKQCSVCHSPGTKKAHIDSDDLGTPQVACASCHDPHQPSSRNRNQIKEKTPPDTDRPADVAPEFVLNFKPQKANNDASADATSDPGDQFGAKNLLTGTWIRPRLHYDYVQSDYDNNTFLQTYLGYKWQKNTGGLGAGDWLRLSPERLCASCHTKGKFLYDATEDNTAITATHQEDVYTQYRNSGHSDKTATPFRRFSLLNSNTSQRPQYPMDVAYSTGTNYAPNGSGVSFACLQCHHGIGSIDYQKGVQGGRDATLDDSSAAHILWGDCTVTCITCHEPHKNGTGTTANIRVPRYLAYSPEFTPQFTPNATGNWRGGSNTMLDLTPIPAGVGNGIICLFCHQGRFESSWTVWNKIRRADSTYDAGTVNGPDFAYLDASQDSVITAGFTVIQNHDLPTANLLWSKNFWEFIPNGNPANAKIYTNGIPQHQATNCTGCHMYEASPDNTEGGHTWIPRLEACQTTGCHPGLTDFFDVRLTGGYHDYNGDGSTDTTAYKEIGRFANIPISYKVPGSNLIWNDASPDLGGSGLLQLVNRAFFEKGVRIEISSSGSLSFRFWNTTATYNLATPRIEEVAFNVRALYQAQAALYVHNVPYAAQILIDGLEKLDPSYTTNPFTALPFYRTTPVGQTTHPASDNRLLAPANN
jgi:pentatricopeptide repeat protein